MRYEIDIHRFRAKRAFGLKRRIRTYRKLAKLLRNRKPLLEALKLLHNTATQDGRDENSPLAIVYQDLIRGIEQGQNFATALEEWAPPTERMIIASGETSGRLENVLDAVVRNMQSQGAILSSVVKGSIYPGFLLAGVLYAINMYGNDVIPAFTIGQDPEKWTGIAYSMYIVSVFAQNYLWVAVAALMIIAIVIFASLPRWRGELRARFDKYPPWSIYRMLQGNAFLSTLAAFMSAGTTQLNALQKMRDVATPWLRERIDGAIVGLKSGLNLGESLYECGYDFPDKEIIGEMQVDSSLSGFDVSLTELADSWLEESVDKVQAIMAFVFVFGIVLMGVVLAWMILGISAIQDISLGQFGNF